VITTSNQLFQTMIETTLKSTKMKEAFQVSTR